MSNTSIYGQHITSPNQGQQSPSRYTERQKELAYILFSAFETKQYITGLVEDALLTHQAYKPGTITFHYVSRKEFLQSGNIYHQFEYIPPQGISKIEQIYLYVPTCEDGLRLGMYQHIIHHELSHRYTREFSPLFASIVGGIESVDLKEIANEAFQEVCVDSFALQIQGRSDTAIDSFISLARYGIAMVDHRLPEENYFLMIRFLSVLHAIEMVAGASLINDLSHLESHLHEVIESGRNFLPHNKREISSSVESHCKQLALSFL